MINVSSMWSRTFGDVAAIFKARLSDFEIADLSEHCQAKGIATSFGHNPSHKRLKEHLLGRCVAYECTRKLTGRDEGLPAGDKVPRWPSGYTGSISHNRDVAVSIVVATSKVISVGIDVESLSTKVTRTMGLIAFDEQELRMIGASSQKCLVKAFSAKEAFYKSVFSKCQVFHDYCDVQVLSVRGGKYRVKSGKTGHYLTVRTIAADGNVYSVAMLNS